VESGIFATNALNSYQGETVVTGGLWGTNVSGGFGNTSGVRVEGTGAVQIFGNATIDKPLSVGGFGSTLVGSYAFGASGAGTRTWSGPIEVTADARFRAFSGATLSLTNTLDLGGNDLTLSTNTDSSILSSGVISGDGNLTVGVSPSTQVGSVFLQGASANTFTGSILVQNARLGFDKDSQFGNGSNAITLENGTIATNNIGGSNITRVLPATRDLTISAGGGRFEARNSQRLDVQTEIKGDGPVGVSGRVTFASGNTFNGSLTLESSSELAISDDSALGPVSNLVRLTGDIFDATLLLKTDGMSLSAGRIIEVPAASQGTLRSDSFGSHTIHATLTGDTLDLADGDYTLTAANSVQRLNLTGFERTLTVASDAALGASDGTVSLLQGTLRAAGDFTFGTDRTLALRRIDGTTSTIDTQEHTLTFNGTIAKGDQFGSPTLRKIGDGTLIFNGNASTIDYFEVRQGTLGGNGTLGEVEIDNAVLSPGQSAGLITFDRLALHSEALIRMELGGTVRGLLYDAINGTSFSVSGSSLVVELIDGFVPSAGTGFQLLGFNEFQGNFGDIQLPALPTSLGWDTSNLLVNGSISVIPEPSTALLGLLTLTLTLVRRRSRC
jgi:hypothetical protein